MTKRILLLAFSCFSFSHSLFAQTPTTTFAPWKNNAKGAYSIIHDDFGSSTVPGIENYADTIAFNRGIKITFGAITSACDANDWNNARRMITHGHEVMNHSHNHYCAYDPGWCETQTWANYATELDQSTNLIQTNTSVYPRFFIWPYDLHTAGSKAHLRDNLNYYGARGGTQDQTLNVNQLNDVTIPDFFSLNFSVFAPATNVTQLNGLVDMAIAQQKWGMRELHGVGDASWGSVSVVNYRAHLNYVRSKMLTNDIWMATATEVTTYKMQTQHFIPTTSYSSLNQEIKITWNTPAIDLTDLRSNVTINVNLDGLTGYTYIYQNNVRITQYTLTSGLLSFNAFPHQGEIKILNAPMTTPQPADFTASTASVCQGQTSVVYTVPNVLGTSYTWNYNGSGVSIVGSTNTITVNYSGSATSGTLSVVANNGAGNSIPRTLGITVNTVPPQPGAFTTSSATVCAGQPNVTYSIPTQTGVTYNWSYTGSNASIAGSTNSVQVSYGSNATSGDVRVSTTNSCGTSTARTQAVVVNTTPSVPSSISGQTEVCKNTSTLLYSTNAVAGVNYAWSYTGSDVGIAQNANEATLLVGSSPSGGLLTVTPSNQCGNGPAAQKTIAITAAPVAPTSFAVFSDLVVQGSQGVEYSVIPAATSSSWVYSGTGVTIHANGGNATLDFGALATSGMLSVKNVNACGEESSALDFAIQVSPLTGTEDRAYYLGVNVYPNPFHEQLTLHVPSYLFAQSITLYSSEGVEVYQKQLQGHFDDTVLRDLRLPSGLYLLNIQGAEETLYIKLIKQ